MPSRRNENLILANSQDSLDFDTFSLTLSFVKLFPFLHIEKGEDMLFTQGKSSIPQFLSQRASLTPKRAALFFEGSCWSFEELRQMSLLYAERLTRCGVSRGQLVAVQMHNSAEMVFIIHGLMMIGAQTVLLNARLTDHEREWQLQDAGAAFLITDKETESKASIITIASLKETEPQSFPVLTEMDLNETATIMYTSGTTGKAKAVRQTYGNHVFSAFGSVLNLGLRDNDKWLCAMPLFHISGLSILLRSAIYGSPVVLHRHFDPRLANQAILTEGVTIMSVVSAMLSRMLDDLGETDYPESFHGMLLGGGPAPMPLLERTMDKGIRVFQTYGMTETSSQIATLAPEDALRKLGSSGKPLYPCEISIWKHDRESNPNEPGEIRVKGPNVTPGYLHGRGKEAFRDGWFYTGDLGYLDEEGYLYMLDRRSDLIISGGENIYPAEVESILSAHPAVKEAGVTGISDDDWGAVPAAALVLKEGAVFEQEEMILFCKERLAKYKIPKRYIILKELPRNASNKLVRKELPKYFL